MNHLVKDEIKIPFLKDINLSIKEIKKFNENDKVLIKLFNEYKNTIKYENSLLAQIDAYYNAKLSSLINISEEDAFDKIAIDEINNQSRAIMMILMSLEDANEILNKSHFITSSSISLVNKAMNKIQPGVRDNPIYCNCDITKKAIMDENNTIKITYIPPHGKEKILDLLNDLFNFVYNDNQYEYSDLLKISLAYYQFENIFPFRDANSRTNRILILLLLKSKDLITEDSFLLSKAIYERKDELEEAIKNLRALEINSDSFIKALISYLDLFYDIIKKGLNLSILYYKRVEEVYLSLLNSDLLKLFKEEDRDKIARMLLNDDLIQEDKLLGICSESVSKEFMKLMLKENMIVRKEDKYLNKVRRDLLKN